MADASERRTRRVRKNRILSLAEKQLEAVFHSLMHITSSPMWNDLTLIRHGPNSLNAIALALTNDHSVALQRAILFACFLPICLSLFSAPVPHSQNATTMPPSKPMYIYAPTVSITELNKSKLSHVYVFFSLQNETARAKTKHWASNAFVQPGSRYERWQRPPITINDDGDDDDDNGFFAVCKSV